MKINWLILSLLSLFSYSLMSFLIVLLTRRGFPVPFVLLGLGTVLVIFFSYQTFFISKYQPHFTIGTILILTLIGILSAFGNLFAYQAATDSPNPGLALAISGMQAGILSILAIIFFKDKLNLLQALGIIFSIIAIVLISLGSGQNQAEKPKNESQTSKSR